MYHNLFNRGAMWKLFFSSTGLLSNNTIFFCKSETTSFSQTQTLILHYSKDSPKTAFEFVCDLSYLP